MPEGAVELSICWAIRPPSLCSGCEGRGGIVPLAARSSVAPAAWDVHPPQQVFLIEGNRCLALGPGHAV
eukprot:scaffold50700_cov31-Tisochrysis_lutea.AAC.1